MKILISYRVMQSWRLPVFIKLSEMSDVELLVVTSSDFSGTKVMNAHGYEKYNFWRKIISVNISVKRNSGNFCLPIAPNLLPELVRFKPDVVITEGVSNIANNFQCFLYCKFFKVPFIQWGLGEIPNRKRNLFSRIVRTVLTFYEGFSDGAIAYSTHGARHYVAAGMSNENISVALNSIDTDKRRAEINYFLNSRRISDLSVFPETNSICYLGALEVNKHVDHLIVLFSKIRPIFPELRLDIVGAGADEERLRELARDICGSDVIFHGAQTGSLCDYLVGSKLLVLPNLGGLVFSEALVHGVPVLTGPADGSEVDLLSHQSEFIMPTNLASDPVGWENRICEILKNSTERGLVQRRGIDFAKGLTSKNYAEIIHSLCKKLLKDLR